MTLIHLVLLRFKADVTQEHKTAFVRELKKLKNLPAVKGGRFFVGGPSLTPNIEWSKGYEVVLVSYHENLEALKEYQASPRHHSFTSKYMFPFDEDLCSYDFEVDPEDEHMCSFGLLTSVAGRPHDKGLVLNGKDE